MFLEKAYWLNERVRILRGAIQPIECVLFVVFVIACVTLFHMIPSFSLCSGNHQPMVAPLAHKPRTNNYFGQIVISFPSIQRFPNATFISKNVPFLVKSLLPARLTKPWWSIVATQVERGKRNVLTKLIPGVLQRFRNLWVLS